MNNNQNRQNGYRNQSGPSGQGNNMYANDPRVGHRGGRPAQGRHVGQHGQGQRGGRPMQGQYAEQQGQGQRGGRPVQRQYGSSTQPPRQQKPPKPQLTPEQLQRIKINREREKRIRKARFVQSVKTFFARLFVYACLVILFGLLTLSVFWLSLTHAETDSESRYSYDIGNNSYRMSYSKAVRDGRVYVSFTDVAELCGLAIIGSPEDMSFAVKGEDTEIIRFVPGTSSAYVNGIETRLGAAGIYEDGEIYVPVEFVSAYVNGVTVEVDERGHKVDIQRIITNLDENGRVPKGEDPIYMDMSFLLQSAAGLKPLYEDDFIDVSQLPDLGFMTNLTVYESYMNPGNIIDYLTLVSPKYNISPDYAPQDLMGLVDTKDDGRTVQQMRENAAWAIEAMFKELRATGFVDVSITSAYRSYSYQEAKFNEILTKSNYDYDYAMAVMRPAGSCEHQLGLCADLHNLPEADVSFGETEAFKWLRDNCWKFGFILRYPADKVDITGCSYEPWHYRYVGRYHAQKMYNEGLCLEEYLGKYYPELINPADETSSDAG